MSKIEFSKYVRLYGFNLNKQEQIKMPIDNEAYKDSIVYTVQNVTIGDKQYLQAVYKSEALDSDKFAIYRKNLKDSKLTYLGVLSKITDGITDYNVASNSQYKYVIHTNPQEDNNASLETPYYNVHWNKWSIVSLNYDFDNNVYVPDDTVFLFSNNLNAGSISDNLNIIKYNTLSQFGRIVQGEQQYDTGSLSCLFGDFTTVQNIQNNKFIIVDNNELYDIKRCVVDAGNDIQQMSEQNLKVKYCELKYKNNKYEGYYIYLSYFDEYYVKRGTQWLLAESKYQYSNDSEKLQQWKYFVKDQKIKLLKSPQGDSWIVAISNATSREIKYESSSYPTTISFDWQEVMDKDKIAIMSW